MYTFIITYTFSLIIILIISLSIVLFLFPIFSQFIYKINKLYYSNLSIKLRSTALSWNCKIVTRDIFPEIIGMHNNFNISLTFKSYPSIGGEHSIRTLIKVHTNISNNISLFIYKKDANNKKSYPVFNISNNEKFIKIKNYELDKYYSFMSNNEKEAIIIINKIKTVLFNKKRFLNNNEILQISNSEIKYEINEIQTKTPILTEKLYFIEEIAKKLELKTA